MTFTQEQLINQAREEVAFWRERDQLIPSQQTAIRLRLAEIALAALTAEPVYQLINYDWYDTTKDVYESVVSAGGRGRIVYAAPPAPVAMKDHQIRVLVNELRDISIEYYGTQQLRERIARTVRAAMLQDNAEPRQAVRSEHAEWSQSTFGDVGHVGPLKHLSTEALEAAAEPGDLSEWADMQFLLWDAQRRAGITDEQITKAMIEKLAVNKARIWPEPKDGEPRLHIKEAPQQENPQIKK